MTHSSTPDRIKRRTAATIAVALGAMTASVLAVAPASADATFADPALQACVNQQLGQPDTAPISDAQAAGVTQLSCTGQGITDLGGLEGFSSLTNLELQVNSVSDLSPLAGLANLEYLFINNNQVSDLTPLAGLTKLKNLYANDNLISELGPLANLTSLTGISMDMNDVSSLAPLAGLSELVMLRMPSNNISDLSPLAGLSGLVGLNLNDNEIHDLSSLSTLPLLREVNVSGNHIADLSPLDGHADLSQVEALNQTITLSDVVIGQSVTNPLREPHGATFTAVSGDSNAVIAIDGKSWSFTVPADNTLAWNAGYPGPVWPAWTFSGTIAQRSIAAPVVPTTMVDDNATTVSPQPVTIDVFANDGLPGEPSLDHTSLTLLDGAGNPVTQLTVAGGLYAVVNDTVLFTPDAGFTGIVSEVSYRATNVDGVVGDAVIRVTVSALLTPAAEDTPEAPGTGTSTGGSSAAHLALTGGSGAGATVAASLGILLVITGVLGLVAARKRARA